MRKFTLVIGLLLSPSAFASSDSRFIHNETSCRIFDMNHKYLRQLPGNRCVYFPDGTFISATNTALNYYDQKLQVLWTKKVFPHHLLNKSLDGKHVLLMSSTFGKYVLDRVRFDRVSVVDLRGQELKVFDFFEHRDELALLYAGKVSGDTIAHRIKTAAPGWYGDSPEFSHANSFYEIGENSAAQKNAAFAKGNYIVNIDALMLTVILDAKLEKILWSMAYPCAREKTVKFNLHLRCRQHDVQVQENGKLLIFNNKRQHADGVYGTVTEYDPITDVTTRLYVGEPKTSFGAETNGSVQRLPNQNLLISDIITGGRAFEVNSSGQIVWSWVNDMVDARKGGGPAPIPQMKRADLTEFLKHNLGL